MKALIRYPILIIAGIQIVLAPQTIAETESLYDHPDFQEIAKEILELGHKNVAINKDYAVFDETARRLRRSLDELFEKAGPGRKVDPEGIALRSVLDCKEQGSV